MIYKKIKVKKKDIRYKSWWDRSYTRKKRETKRMYMKWRRGKGERKGYIESKKEFREFLIKKRKVKREEEETEVRNIKKKSEIWAFINRRRKKREWRENNISSEAWREHFMNLLGGKEIYREETENIERIGIEEGEDLKDEEIGRAVRKLKHKKALGIHGIPAEAWKYGGEPIVKRLKEVIRKVWEEGKIPGEWKTSIIVSIYKRGDQNKVENYRGISLLCSAYKVYAEILKNRLENEVEEKDLLPESQTDFKKGRSTIENIFTLNHIVQRKKKKVMNKGKCMRFLLILRQLLIM